MGDFTTVIRICHKAMQYSAIYNRYVCVCVYLVMYSNSTTYFYNLLCLSEKYLIPYMGCHYNNCSMQPQFLEMINYCDTPLVGGIFFV